MTTKIVFSSPHKIVLNLEENKITIQQPGSAGSGGGVSDHGALTGLGDDDHPQYLNNVRGDVRYYQKGQTDTLLATKVDAVTGKQLSTEDYTTAEKTKLAGIAPGATVNSPDATLLNRANHTGTEPATAILQDATHRFVTDTEKTTWNGKQDYLGFTAVPETRQVNGHPLSADVTVTKSDVGLGNVPNLDVTNPSNITQDATHRFFTDTERTKLTGVATGATANSSDATLLSRANHTGTQPSSTISDFLSSVLASVLTGLSTASSAVVTATDTVLSAIGKLQAQISANTTNISTNTSNIASNTSAIAGKEPTISAGTTSQYWRGDKTWQDFATDVRTAVLTGLSLASGTVISASDTVLSALGKLQNQVSSNTTNIASNTSALAGKEPTITAGTTSQYWRGDKTWQDLFTDVRAAVLTGLSTATNSTILAADTLIVALGKLQAQINSNVTSIAGKLTASSNLSDLGSASTARTNLGLGTAATQNTSAFLQPANNLSDVSSLSTARSNLGAKAPDVQVFTSSGTWNKPSGGVLTEVLIIGPGGGGGAGGRFSTATANSGGAGGGGGGRSFKQFRTSDLGATETVTVGSAGTAGAAQTVNDTIGGAGGAGGSSTFGQWLKANGGTGGGGGGSSGATAGTGGTGNAGSGGTGAGANASNTGSSPSGTTTGGAMGGGSGGGANTSSTAFAGGGVGTSISTNFSFVSGGSVPAGAGSPGIAGGIDVGGGGSGAAGSVTVAGGAGGKGGAYGGGGGGGGCAPNGQNSGAGGAGGDSIVVVTTWF